jgi:hypothetical protein
VPTGGVSVGTDVIWIKIVLLGVRSQPAHGALAILECRRKRRLA